MQFVEQHLTKHHFFHAPHRFFLALLLSPIHAAERHYQKRYHLRFRHARKLFFFDMCLLASIVFLFVGTLFWHFYDPTVRSLVGLSVETSTERIKTGTEISYTISYTNHSDVPLVQPLMSFTFPKGFVMDTSTAPQNFQTENSSITLSTLPPNGHGTMSIKGTLFGTPDAEYDTVVKLSYLQEGEYTREFVIDRIITSPRDTPLAVEWKLGTAVLANGSAPFSLFVSNTGTENLEGIHISLPQIHGVQFQTLSKDELLQQGATITVPLLLPHASTTILGTILTNLDTQTKTLAFDIIPTLRANNEDFPQKHISKSVQVIHPTLESVAVWKKETAKPSERAALQIQIKNTNAYDIHNVQVTIPLPNTVDGLHMTQHGFVKNNIFTTNKNYIAALGTIKSGEQVTLDLIVPIGFIGTGKDITVHLTPEIHADIPLVEGASYIQKINSTPLKISSVLSLRSEMRYYTSEGDQLGRGPLPPQVGAETRYFATLVMSNSTSDIEKATVSATLSPDFVWGEKTSVSFGKDVTYDEATRKITWTAPLVPAHSDVGISFAVLFTPKENHIAKTPMAIQNISASAIDSFTQSSLSASARALDISLPTDTIGKEKGVQVVE